MSTRINITPIKVIKNGPYFIDLLTEYRENSANARRNKQR